MQMLSRVRFFLLLLLLLLLLRRISVGRGRTVGMAYFLVFLKV